MTWIGRQVGRYRLLEQIGSGGMAVVFKGLDTALDREVAVKILHPHLAGKDESRKRLAREAKAVAKLHHPNILEVFDYSGPEVPDAYIVTEYIRGQTLRQYVQAQPLSPPDVAAMVVHQIAVALAHAHEAGVIHRDLKPENVMVRQDGVLKLMDFGIAKIVDRDDRMTMTGALVGSPAHMAPEIIEGEESGPPADVFSLGTMLYLFATGRLPFLGANTTATLKKILDGAYEDPRQLAPVSDELADLLARCLARKPQDRFQDARQLAEALSAYLADLDIDRVGEALAAYFAQPGAQRPALIQKMTARLVARGQLQLEQRRPGKALSALNHALALDPAHPGALELLRRMNVAQARRRLLRRSGYALATVAVLAGLAVGARSLRLPRPASGPRAGVDAPLPPEPVNGPSQPALTVAAPGEGAEQRPSGEPASGHSGAAATTVIAVQRTAAATGAGAGNPSSTPDPSRPAKALPVQIDIRPYGYVRVANAPRSPQLAVHLLQLPPGEHAVTVGCEKWCEDSVRTVQVPAAGRASFRFLPTLKPGRVAFELTPPEALVTLDGITRPAQQTAAEPFLVRSDDNDARKALRHEVSYELSAPGYVPVRRTAVLTPGELTVIRGELQRAP